jgi:hypothetical protein
MIEALKWHPPQADSTMSGLSLSLLPFWRSFLGRTISEATIPHWVTFIMSQFGHLTKK